MATIRNLCTRCIVLDKGKLVYDGNTEEAIAIYLNEVNSDFPVKYDCKDIKRNIFHFGKKVKINGFEFIGKQCAQFDITEKMRFRVIWTAMENVSNLHVRFAVKYVDSTNVGMAESCAFINAKQGEEHSDEFEYDLSNLSTGTYYLKLFFFIIDSLGTYHDLDAAMAEIYFEVNDTNMLRPIWKQQFWGNVRLNPIIKKD
ncbi:MAG TPA: hypothetical protein DCR27_05040 [Lachnospiraceae bacterium]|nr:hypothetical protein [Lachnospiraceae bacterium]